MTVLITITVFMIISGNPFMTVGHGNMFVPTDQKKLIQLALSDQRVKQALDNRPYHIYFDYGGVIPNVGVPFTDTIIKFVFDDNSYVLVRENLFQNKVIDIQSGSLNHNVYAETSSSPPNLPPATPRNGVTTI
ncbi:MAG: hypothetical protein KGI27_05665 [Thaumarchaeota archaeon]|nr:hypothetical protein [Nitrososphaerota archaeon]